MRILLLLWLLTLPSLAQALVPRPEAGGVDLPPLECTDCQVTVTIEHQVAHVRIEQTFLNRTSQDLEAVYFLPLHESASISAFSYWVGGQEIKGSIHEKAEARAIYESIVAKRRDPALLEHADRNLFRVNIFPVSSREPMKVRLEYDQLCPYDDGVVTFRYPLTAGGRQQRIGNFGFKATVRDSKPIESLEPGQLKDRHHGEVVIEKQGFTPETDVQVSYRLKSQDLGLSFLTHRQPGQDGYYMLIVAPQEDTQKSQVIPKDVVFVFDRSGSMAGEKIRQAQAALNYCLNMLGPEDRFELLTFSDRVEGQTGLLPASPQNVQAALKTPLVANGGTNIHQALTTAMRSFQAGPRQKIVIFMTDGLPTVGEKSAGTIVEAVRQANQEDVRLFAFGVGDDLDDYLLLKLADDNRGALQYVRAGESIERKIGAFFAKISTPLLTDLDVDYGGARVVQTYPDTLPDVFKGSQLILVGRYRSHGPADLLVTGSVNGQERRFTHAVTFPEQQQQNAFLPRLWAKQRVNWAVDEMRLYGENEELKKEVVELGKRYTLVTPYTSFLAVPKKEQLAASSAPGYPTGSDPILSVAAPQDARVTAWFPWGEVRPLRFDARLKCWRCRFIIPKWVAHGKCEVTVLVKLASGQTERRTVCFEADCEPPTGDAVTRLQWTPQGWLAHLEVNASTDTRRVVAQLPDGRWVELTRDPRTGRWLTVLPKAIKGPVVVTLLDNGHNRTTLKLEVNPK